VIDWELLIETGLVWIWKAGVVYGSYKWGRLTAPKKNYIAIGPEITDVPPFFPLWVKASTFVAFMTYVFYEWASENGPLFFLFQEELSPFLGILVVLLGAYFIGYHDASRSNKD